MRAGAAAGIALAVVSGSAIGQSETAQLSASNRRLLERAIGRAAETVRSGQSVTWRGQGETGGVIVMDKAISRASREVCDDCRDPCRPVRYTVVTATALSRFEGMRCRATDAGAANWFAEGEDAQVQHLALAPIPQPPAAHPPDIPAPVSVPQAQPNTAVVSEMQNLLSGLRYYNQGADGRFSFATQRALAEFLADERSSVPATANSEALDLLRAAHERSARHRPCSLLSDSQAYSGCGVLAQAN